MGTSLQKSFCWSPSWKENRLKELLAWFTESLFGFEMEAYTQWVLLTLIADDKFHLVGGKNTFVVLSEIIFHNFDTKIYCRFPRNPFTIDKVDQWPDHLWQPWKDSPHRAPGTNLQKRQITKPSTSDQYYGGVGMLISAALYVIVVYY